MRLCDSHLHYLVRAPWHWRKIPFVFFGNYSNFSIIIAFLHPPKVLLFGKIFKTNLGRGCGSVGIAAASNLRVPRFESQSLANFIYYQLN